MKHYRPFLAIFFSLFTFLSECCPTCPGRITKDSAPFFSDEFYVASAESMDELYQQLLEEELAQNKQQDTQ